MPGAKDYKQCKLEDVKKVTAAQDAISAEPGAKPPAPEGSPEEQKAGDLNKPAGGAGEQAQNDGQTEQPLSWVGVEVVDQDNKPVQGISYTIKLPDGSIQEGVTDEEGKARYEAVEEGSVYISLDELHGDEWEPA